MSGRARERGSATVVAVGACAAICSAAAGMALMVDAARAGHRAAAAADLAALAAAPHAARAEPSACAHAALVAARNGAELVDCVVAGDGSVTVVCTVRTGWGPVARGRARAGVGLEQIPSRHPSTTHPPA